MSIPESFRLAVLCSLAAIGTLVPPGATAGLSSSAGNTVGQANRGTHHSPTEKTQADLPQFSGIYPPGATAGLSSSAGNTVGQANRGTHHSPTEKTQADLPQFSRVYPHLAAMSDSYSEAGIGAVVPWAGRLWYVSYVAHRAGARVGLYEVMPDLTIRHRPESIVGTHAGRMIHRESNQLILGPYVIDASGNVRVLKQLAENERVTAIARHLFDPAHKVYVQAMEGKYYEVDVRTLEVKLLGDAREELGVRGNAHFKGAYTAQGRYVVANNSYDAPDAREGSGEGRLAAWDGRDWTLLHRTAFCDVTTAAGVEAVPDDNGPLWSTGWDRRSVLLAVLAGGQWTTYRLPKGSQAYDHAWCTEWPRIRQAEPGRWMLDMHGLFYLFPPGFRPGSAGGIEPLAYHLRMTPDFCFWQDRLVLAGDQNSSMGHRHRTGGQPQSNLWFGSFDELRGWGRPAGWGGPWLDDAIEAGRPSEPFFIGGFTRRSLHLVQTHAATGMPSRPVSVDGPVAFTLEIDRDGSGHWSKYETVDVPAGGYAWRILPDELPGCWMRITADRATTASAQFIFGPKSSPLPQAGEGSGVRGSGQDAGRQKPPVQRQEPSVAEPSLFQSLPPAEQQTPRLHAAVLPFADRLWISSYRSDAAGKAVEGLGLYEVDAHARAMRRSESIDGIFSNRKMVGGRLSIGPHLIGDDGRVQTFAQLQGEHVVASIRTPGDPGHVLFLTVDGRLLRGDPKTLEIEPAADIPQALGLGDAGLRFKAGHQAGATIFVAATAADGQSGCLAEWDGTATGWRLIDRAAYAEVCNWGSMSETVVAAGWDRASSILRIRSSPGWITYRLPKASEHYSTDASEAGSRIREVETERILMDLQGIFYETTGLGHAWFVRPIATHDRIVSDFCSWRGMTVLAGVDAVKPAGPGLISDGPNAAVWAGKTDDLWQLGFPRGQGGPWLETAVRAGDVSEPYLMTNFDHKRVELRHDADGPVEFTILVDPLGTRKSWKTYKRLTVPAGQTVIEVFPEGFAAHWVRVSVDRDCRATAWLVYD